MRPIYDKHIGANTMKPAIDSARDEVHDGAVGNSGIEIGGGVGGMHSAIDWLQLIALGALVGALGQGARVIIGIKKLIDKARSARVQMTELFMASRLVISLGIGAVAGAAAAIVTIDNLAAVTLSQIMGIAAAGYAGADFIEGFVSRSQLATRANPLALDGPDAAT